MRRWWGEVVTAWVFDEAGVRLLTATCEAWDRMTEARKTLAKEGTVYRDRFDAPRKHPAVSIEENARVAFMRGLRELRLDEPPQDSRPPRMGGRR
jgi:phage terminase small subunit